MDIKQNVLQLAFSSILPFGFPLASATKTEFILRSTEIDKGTNVEEVKLYFSVYDNNNPNAIYKSQVNGTSNTNKEVNRATCFIQPYITPENNNTNLIIVPTSVSCTQVNINLFCRHVKNWVKCMVRWVNNMLYSTIHNTRK